MGKLDGKVILVTGGARGQGEAHARLYVQEGARVVVGDVLDAEGQAVAVSLGEQALYVHQDVSEQEGWDRLISEAKRRFGRIDGLVNNAGIIAYHSILDMPLAQYRKIVAVNQIGTFLGVQAAAKAMIEAGHGGSIVNIGSGAGLQGYALCTGYVDSKFAVRGLTRTAAIELGRYGIRVNAIHPGFINTQMGVSAGDNEQDFSQYYEAIPIGRIGEPSEIARLGLFLLSEDSSFCTGSEFLADGGELAGDSSLLKAD